MHCIDWWLETRIFCCITKIMLNRNHQIVSLIVDEAYAELFIMVKMYKKESFELCIIYEYSDEAS